MTSSLRRSWRSGDPSKAQAGRRRRHKIALLLPAVVVVSTVLSGPAYADDVDDPAPASPDTSQSTPTPDPAPSPDPKPEPEPDPKPDPKPDPAPAPSNDPAPADQPSASDESKGGPGKKDEGKQLADQAPQTDESAPAPALSPSAGTVFSAAAEADANEAAVPAAANEKKVVVCKYVSTPGGYSHHVIVPSVNSLKDWDPSMGFPSFAFADAQNSIAIRYLDDDEVPGQVPDSVCPSLIKRPVPTVVNPCGPDNAVWADLSGTGFTAVRQLDGSLVVTASPGYWFAPLTIPPTTEFTVPAPVDNDPVDQDCDAPAAVVPPDPQPVDECGNGIVQWADPPNSPDYTWVRNGDGSVTFTPVAPAVFPGGVPSISWPVPTVHQEACPKKVVVCKYVSTPAGFEHHIVIVSVNAVDPSGSGKTWDQVTDADFPFPFEDAQDSIAIAFADKGDQSHDFTPEDCGTKIDPPVVPQLDPCNPTGVTSNIHFGAIPDGAWTADTSVAGKITFTATGTNYFSTTGEGEDKVFVKTYVVNLGADSGEKCLIAPAIAPNDPCNPAGVTSNATWVLPAETADYSVSVVNGVIKLIGKLGKVFESGDSTYTYNLAATPVDSGVVCEVGGVEETSNPPKDAVDSEQAATGLPNTGGPAGWLMPLGVGLVLAGAGLVLARRKTV
jgi:LPXTG-motif cell wall-anchored protein